MRFQQSASSRAGSRGRASARGARAGRRRGRRPHRDRPREASTSVPISGSLWRRCNTRSSIWRASARGQNVSPASTSASMSAGGASAGPPDVDAAGAYLAIELGLYVRVDDAFAFDAALQVAQTHPPRTGRAIGSRRECMRARLDRGLEIRRGRELVHQAPLQSPLAANPFLGRGEEVGPIPAHLALVDDADQAAGARKYAEERHLRQRHRARAVVDEEDPVGGHRELVAASRRGAVDRAQVALARMRARVPRSRIGSRW